LEKPVEANQDCCRMPYIHSIHSDLPWCNHSVLANISGEETWTFAPRIGGALRMLDYLIRPYAASTSSPPAATPFQNHWRIRRCRICCNCAVKCHPVENSIPCCFVFLVFFLLL